jgi:hypothetical protein
VTKVLIVITPSFANSLATTMREAPAMRLPRRAPSCPTHGRCERG